MKLATTLLAISLSTLANAALYDGSSPVVTITEKNFRKEVMDTEHLVALEFYAPWCGHCQRLAPEWNKAADNLRGLVKVAAIDCDADANKAVCNHYEIKGFPTIKIFPPELKPDKKNPEMVTKRPSDYQGPREAKPIVDHLLSMMPSNVRFVKSDLSGKASKKSITIDDFLGTENATLPKTLLFTSKPSTPALYKALSVDLNERMLLGEVRNSELAVVEQFGVKNFPTVVVIPAGGEGFVYDGKVNMAELKVFLEKYAKEAKVKSGEDAGAKKEKKKEKKEEVKVEFDPKITEITSQSTLEAQCLTLPGLCVLAILPSIHPDDPSTAQAHVTTIPLLETLKRKAHDLNTPFRFMWIDATRADKIIDKLDVVRDFPAMVVIHPGKKMYRPFVGAWEEEGVGRWLEDLRGGKVRSWSYEGNIELVEVEVENEKVEKGKKGKDEL